MPSQKKQDFCPFCSMPIVREYGSFRCRSCAKSSEDLLDLERKKRAQEVRKAAREAEDEKAAAEAKRRALALAVARHLERKRSGQAAAADAELVAAGPKKRARRSA